MGSDGFGCRSMTMSLQESMGATGLPLEWLCRVYGTGNFEEAFTAGEDGLAGNSLRKPNQGLGGVEFARSPEPKNLLAGVHDCGAGVDHIHIGVGKPIEPGPGGADETPRGSEPAGEDSARRG